MIRVMTTFGADGSRYTRLIGADGRVVIERSAAAAQALLMAIVKSYSMARGRRAG